MKPSVPYTIPGTHLNSLDSLLTTSIDPCRVPLGQISVPKFSPSWREIALLFDGQLGTHDCFFFRACSPPFDALCVYIVFKSMHSRDKSQ